MCIRDSIFGRGSAPDPAGGAYSAPSDPLPGLRGRLLLRERGGEGKREEGKGGEIRGREGGKGEERRGRKGTGEGPPLQGKCLDPPLENAYYRRTTAFHTKPKD